MRILVWGTGSTGIATAKEMKRQGHEVRLVDENIPSRDMDIPVEILGPKHMDWAELVIPSPGIPRNHPLLAKAKRVVSEIEMASRLLHGKIIGVTGTNGKTTTVTLIHSILSASGHDVGLGGNISPPLISLAEADPAIVVAEISSFQLEWIETFRPFIAVCLNLSPDHLDRYRDMEEYTSQKMRIFQNQGKDDIAVVNDDDPYLKDIRFNSITAGFALSKGERSSGAYLKDGYIYFYGEIEGKGPSLKHTKVRSKGLIEDMMASALVTRFLGVSTEIMEKVFMEFRGIKHRFELVAEMGGVRFINDSKATNVGAVEKALAGVGSRVVLILGGRDKGGDFSSMAQRYASVIKKAIIIGEASQRIKKEVSPFVGVYMAQGMEEAVRQAIAIASPGETVLLSPGCSSFDMFKNYEHRGDVFTRCVTDMSMKKN